jgi:uncharacterized protein (TIGR02284 family)
MGTTTDALNALLEALIDSAEFYDEAAARVGDTTYQALFRRMGANKRAIAADLRAEVSRRGGELATQASHRGTLRQGWADLRARLSAHPELAFVSQLEETEDAVIRAFREAVLESERAEVRAIAQKHMAEINRMHEEIRTLKHRLQKAA